MGQAPSSAPYLQTPVDNPVGLKVFIILSKWIGELLCHAGSRRASGNPQVKLFVALLATLKPWLLPFAPLTPPSMPFLPDHCL